MVRLTGWSMYRDLCDEEMDIVEAGLMLEAVPWLAWHDKVVQCDLAADASDSSKEMRSHAMHERTRFVAEVESYLGIEAE